MNFGGAFSKKREKPQKNRLKLSLKNNKLVLKTKKMQKKWKKFKKSVDTGMPNMYTATTVSKGADVVRLSEKEKSRCTDGG